jgi:hypothetical protein
MKTKRSLFGTFLAIRVGLVLGLGLGIALIAPVAQADQIEMINGTACTPNRADAGKINYSRTLGIFNEGTSSGTIYCPVVYTDSSVNELARSVRVNVVDRHTSSNISCTANGLYEDGTVGVSGGTYTTSGASSGVQSMYWDLAQGFIYNVYCVLPAQQGSNQSRLASFGTYMHD